MPTPIPEQAGGRRAGSVARWGLRLLLLAVAGAVLLWAFGYRLKKIQDRTLSFGEAPQEPTQALGDGAFSGPENLIVFVADGMGFAHLSAGRAVSGGVDGPAAWDRFESTGWHRSHPERGFLTDSAASATALAIGESTFIGAVGVNARGETRSTLLERAQQSGFRTGVVTDSYIWDATPAAFSTHTDSRDNAAAILTQLADSELEVAFGELEDVGEDEVPDWATTIGLLEQRFHMLVSSPGEVWDLRTAPPAPSPVAAVWEEEWITNLDSQPNLPTLVRVALDRLDSDERPFALLVESEEPDSASHRNDLERLLSGLETIEATLEVVLDFAERDGETLVVFTSDHETGGLALSVSDESNSILRAMWSTRNHTGVAVPLLAFGPGAERFSGIHTSAGVGRLLQSVVGTGDAEDADAGPGEGPGDGGG